MPEEKTGDGTLTLPLETKATIADPEEIKAAIVPAPVRGAAALTEVGERGVLLKNLDELIRFARMAVASGLAPKGMNEQAAALCVQAGMERGMGPLGGLQTLVAINGNLSWRGQAAYALIQNSSACKRGSLRFWGEGEGDNMMGVAVAQRVGYSEPERREFTVEDAKRAKLWQKRGRDGQDTPWVTYPKRMLAWRALGLLARDVFPDVLGGFPLAEEAQDFEERIPSGKGETPATRAAMLPPPAADPLLEALPSEDEEPGQ